MPAIAISPWIAERTVVSEPYRHTSLIRTMRKRWGLGQPLTARDADAPDIAPVLSREQPRAPEEWPDVAPQPVPEFEENLVPREAPLSDLAKAVFHAYLALVKALGQPVAEVA